MMKNIVALIVCLFIALGANAQCQDTTNVQPGAFCPPLFEPVCGCDGVTYTNICVAQTQNGIFQYNSGVCGGVDFVFGPNPVKDVIYLKAVINETGYLRLQIIDRYGRVFYNNFYQNVLADYVFEISVDITEVPTDYCFIYMETNDGFKVKPFIKFRAQ